MRSLSGMEITPTDRALARALSPLPGVRAIAVGGSRATGSDDAASDTDLYALVSSPVDAGLRRAALAPLADGGQVVCTDAFGPEDHLSVGGRDIEVVHLDLPSLERQVSLAHDPGLMGEGFSTCFLHTVAVCVPLADDGALAALKDRLALYPAATRRRIVGESRELLDTYLAQMAKAQQRGDLEMVVHRRASFQAVWFNVLFAANGAYHPGEKRLLEHAAALPLVPEGALGRLRSLAALGAQDPALVERSAALAEELYAVVEERAGD